MYTRPSASVSWALCSHKEVSFLCSTNVSTYFSQASSQVSILKLHLSTSFWYCEDNFLASSNTTSASCWACVSSSTFSLPEFFYKKLCETLFCFFTRGTTLNPSELFGTVCNSGPQSHGRPYRPERGHGGRVGHAAGTGATAGSRVWGKPQDVQPACDNRQSSCILAGIGSWGSHRKRAQQATLCPFCGWWWWGPRSSIL